MSVVYAAALKTARMEEVLAAIDAGAGAGKIKLYTAGDVLLNTFTLPDPSGSVSGDTLTFDMDPDIEAPAEATGTATKATITDSDDNVIVSGLTVGTAGTNFVFDTNVISAVGQVMKLVSGTIQHG